GDRGRLFEIGLSGEIALKEGIRARGKRGAKHGLVVGDLIHGRLQERRHVAARYERLDGGGARRTHGAEQHVDLVGIEELARLDERRRRIVSRVLYDGLDGQATELAVCLLEIEQEAVALRHAERAERTGEFGQHADLDRVLRLRACRHAEYHQPQSDQQTQATHLSLLSCPSCWPSACDPLQPARSLMMNSSAIKRIAGASICTKFFSSSRIMAGIADANIARMSSVDLK